MSKKMMKRSLALSALMAFVITGSAYAEVTVDTSTWAKYHCLKGTEDVVDSTNTNAGGTNRLIGGWFVGANNNAIGEVEKLNSNLTIDGGNWNLVIGGNYASVGKNGEKETNFDVQSTKVVVNDGKIHQLAAGTGGTDNWKLTHSGAESSILIINGGTFGETSVAGNCPELLVTAGDLLKDGDDETANWKLGASSAINEVTTTINDGNFNAAIIGGSSAIQYYGTTGDYLDKPCDRLGLNTSVVNANTTINGGTFNHAIIAGGFAYGWYANSSVEKAVLNINGNGEKDLTIKGDIYAGGMSGNVAYERFETDGVKKLTTIASVGSAEINVVDAVVANIYGNAALISQPGGSNTDWVYSKNSDVIVNTALTLTNATVTGVVDVAQGSVTLSATENGTTEINTLKANEKVKVAMVADSATTDALKGDVEAFAEKITITTLDGIEYSDIEGKMSAGEVIGDVTFKLNEDGEVVAGSVKEAVNTVNQSIGEAAVNFKAHYRAHMNDMNKRMGELRMANGETGVWTRMVRGENEFEGAKSQYNQYQLGYDEKLSVDKRWTVGAAVTFAEGNGHFAQGSNEDDSTAFAIYGSKLNNDGTFVDLIARYAHLESDLTIGKDKADYSTNGYSVSAEFGKRIQQGNGMWIEPQVELIYGSIDSADYKVGNKTVQVGDMDSLIGRVGFRVGKDIEAGNVYARASYLYDFDGETENTFSASGLTRTIEEDLGGGWWEVGVGANINLSKATYIYADVEKTFGGEIDTNWQWNLGVRYSF